MRSGWEGRPRSCFWSLPGRALRSPRFSAALLLEVIEARWIYVTLGNRKLCKFAMFSRDSYLWTGILNSSAEVLNHYNKFMLFRLSYIVINFFLSMNEEIHGSSNILCISSKNDRAYCINLENNRRRFTMLEEKIS